MKKIDLHQDVILTFQENLAGFGDAVQVNDVHGTYAGNKTDYEQAACQIVRAANWPYRLDGDLEDIKNRVITYDQQLLLTQHDAMEQLIQQYHCTTITDKSMVNDLEGLSFLHHIEGIDHEITFQELEKLYNRGVRSIGFCWNFDNFLATNNTSTSTGGLTSLGKAIVLQMHELGMIIDTAHMNHQSMMDVVRIAKKPILNSHSNLKHFCAHTRNVEDEFLYALKDNGGVLGLSVYQDFVGAESVDAYIQQIAYVIDLIGPDHVALGTDFHGLPTKKCLVGLQHISDLIVLENRLIAAFGESFAQKFFWDNSMRVLQANL